MASTSGKVSFGEKISYSLSSAGGNIITQILGTFLASYLTDSVGIAAAAVGTMLLVTRFFDGASDLIMGGIIDRTKTRWGKARPWLLFSAPLICIGLIIEFSTPMSLGDTGKLVWAYLTYIFLNVICFTAYMVSDTALLARITLDGHERQKMSSMNQIVNQIAGLLVTTFTVTLISKYGWQTTAIIYGILAMVLILIGFFGCREHLDADSETNEVHVETVPLKTALPAMAKNKYFFLLAALFILILMQMAGTGSVTFYYCNSVLNNLDMIAVLSAAGMIPMVIINLFVPALTKKFGRRICLIVSAVVNVLGYLFIGMAGQNLTLVIVGSVLKGAASGVIFACAFAMSADVIDYGEWKTGIRSEGLINSCVSFGQKVGLGLGPAIAAWIVAAGGYDGMAATQSASAVSAITFSYGYYGAIISALILVVAFFLNLDKYSDQIREDLEKKHMHA